MQLDNGDIHPVLYEIHHKVIAHRKCHRKLIYRDIMMASLNGNVTGPL